MKHLFKLTIGVLILAGAGLAVADEGIVTSKPLVNTQVNADANAESSTKMTGGSADVNETDSVEINKAAIRDNEVNIHAARADVDRDTQKLTDDTEALKDAQSRTDDQAIAKSKADVDADKALVDKDRERLQKHIGEKIENDKVVIHKFDDRIRHTRKDVAHDSKKLLDDTAKLADAQTKNAADDIEKDKSDVETDKAVVDADTTKLNDRIAFKAKCVLELKNDRRHLNEVVKHLPYDEEASASDTTTADSSASAQ
jgi:hypothetical protein